MFGERHRVFCNSLADVFEDRPDLSAPRHRLWRLILDTRHSLDWLLLTKRPENFNMIPLSLADSVWLGVSVEDRKNKHRIDILRQTPAALRFLSLEPLLEDLGELDLTGISWCIIGGESGPGARRCDVDWIRKIVWQCQAASIPVFVKQLGAHVIENGERRIKRDKKGGDMDEWAHDIRVREWPEVPHAK
jgi:protein gp37